MKTAVRLCFFVFVVLFTSLACRTLAGGNGAGPDSGGGSGPVGEDEQSPAGDIPQNLDVVWQQGELTLYTDSAWELSQAELTGDQLLTGLAGLDRVDLAGVGMEEVHAIYAASYDTAYASVFAPIQLLVASGKAQIVAQSTFTLNNRLMAFWEVEQGDKVGLIYAIQVESGEGISLITWVRGGNLDDYRDFVADMAAAVDTNRAQVARAAGPSIPQPENTLLTYAETGSASLAGELTQQWTWEGKAGEIIRVTISDGVAPIQLTILDPAGAAMAYTPSHSPFDSDPIVLPVNGTYSLRLKTSAGLTTNYSVQINQLQGSEVPLGQQTEITYNEDAPYFIFWGEAGRSVRIVATAETKTVGVVFYATSFAQWRHGSPLEIRARLPYSGPYLVKLYNVPEGNQTVSVLVEQGEAENLDELVVQQQLLNVSQELDFPVTAELIPGETFPALSASDCDLHPCTFLFVGEAGQEVTIIASHKTYGSRSPTIIFYFPTGGEWLRLPSTRSEDYEADFTLGPIILPVTGIYRLEVHESRYITLIRNEP